MRKYTGCEGASLDLSGLFFRVVCFSLIPLVPSAPQGRGTEVLMKEEKVVERSSHSGPQRGVTKALGTLFAAFAMLTALLLAVGCDQDGGDLSGAAQSAAPVEMAEPEDQGEDSSQTTRSPQSGGEDGPEDTLDLRLSQAVYTLSVGDSAELETQSFGPAAQQESTVYTYSSSDPTVVQVDQDGQITALSPGTVVVTVTGQGEGVTAVASAQITVPSAVSPGIYFTQQTEVLTPGRSAPVGLLNEQAQPANSGIVWTNENPELFSFDSATMQVTAGEQTGVGYLTAQRDDHTDRMEIRIVPADQQIALSCVSITMAADSRSNTQLYVFDGTAFFGQDYAVTWSVDDESVLSLEEENASGVTFRAKQLGRALITCQVSLPDGTTGEAYCTVLVLFDH